jgi:two-component system, LytTR family, sensor kinase
MMGSLVPDINRLVPGKVASTLSITFTSLSCRQAARGRRLRDTSSISDSDATPGFRAGATQREDAAASFPLSTRMVVLLTAGFWSYVTLTDILYAEGMRVDVAQFTSSTVFASWKLRLLQHVLVFPVLAGCYRLASRLGWTPLRRRLPIQIALALLFAVLPFWMMDLANLVVYRGFEPWVSRGGPTREDMAIWFASAVATIPTYGFGLALVSGAGLYRRIHGLRLRNAELKSDWADARLVALRTQLSPHTLFNLLHNIQAQIPWDPEVARSSVVSLAELLRRLLRAGERDFSLLGDEMHFVKLYFALQLTRFADRMTVSLPDIEGLPAVWVPSLILQPLVENAVVHGLDGHSGPVRIGVTVALNEDELLLRVTNSTATREAPGSHGIGLRNVRERLAVQFGSRASLRSGPGRDASWVAELRLPVLREWQPSARSAASA